MMGAPLPDLGAPNASPFCICCLNGDVTTSKGIRCFGLLSHNVKIITYSKIYLAYYLTSLIDYEIVFYMYIGHGYMAPSILIGKAARRIICNTPD